MKPGLRLQIVCLTALLLLLGFVPLYLAIETYTDVALSQTRTRDALSASQQLARTLSQLEPRALARQLRSLTADPLRAAAALDARGEPLQRYGPPRLQRLLFTHARELAASGEHSSRVIHHDGVTYVLARASAASGPAPTVLVLTALSKPNPESLNRLLGLYVALVGGALLVGVYFTVTHWIIRPLDELTRSARGVASSSHRLQLPPLRAREFVLLAESLSAMTDQLLREEAVLRNKVRELEAARDELRDAQAQLVRSERLASVGQLAAGLAHEVGNPIAAISGLQDLILEGDLSHDEQLDFVRRMRAETERINRVLRDLLQFARPTADPRHGPSEPGQLDEALRETLALLSPQPMLRQVQIDVNLEPELPRVPLDAHQLTQVLLNLLLNAAAACHGRGHVVVSAMSDGDMVSIVVQDDGPGVEPGLRDTLFEPFVSSKEIGEGSGLGLSVCRGLIESAGGSVELDLTHEPGARFVIRLPARRDDARAARPAGER